MTSAELVVQTVTGPLPIGELGFVLMHEHVINYSDHMRRQWPHLHDYQNEAVDVASAALTGARGLGVHTVVDCTTPNMGRQVRQMEEVSRRSGMNIIFCTGYHPMIGADFYFDVARGTGIDIDDLAEMFIHDIRVGAQGTDRKASIIKVGTAPSGDEWQERGLRAAARAHRATGVPITTHSEPADRDGLYQLDVFESEGVDLSRVIIGHSGDSSDREYLSELVARGCYIGMDRFGFMIETFLKPLSTEERIEIVKDMISRDAVGAMVMSHDSCSWCDYVPPDYIQEINPEWNICYLMDTAMPQMRAAGVSDAAIETMATQNPRDIFSNVEPY